MAHVHAARRFLDWFCTEAQDKGEEGGVFYATGSDFVVRYRDRATGRMVNAIDYVQKLATQRLTVSEADKVVEEARKLLSA